MNLPEKYRPRDWSEVVGQDKVVVDLLRLRDTTGLGGNAFWIAGKSGTGKTTIAKLIAAEVADPYCVDQLHARELTPSTLRQIDESMGYRGFGQKGGRAWIVDDPGWNSVAEGTGPGVSQPPATWKGATAEEDLRPAQAGD